MKGREPDFENILKILGKGKPERPTLFEFFLNLNLYNRLADEKALQSKDDLRQFRIIISAFKNSGFDYATIPNSLTNTLWFKKGDTRQINTKSLNEGFLVTDAESFEKYDWPNPDKGNYELFESLEKETPAGMKLIACGPGGVLENAVELVGYENLCMLSLTDEELTGRVFDAIGSRLVRYYQIVSSFPVIGAVISNDDWGFKTQTMFSPEMLRKFVFPWHKKIADTIHSFQKPAILHSCGNLSGVMEDVIQMEYDGKHSFEDIISPVENEWKKYHQRIAILGGIDMNFLAVATPEEIRKRAGNLVDLTSKEGSYALGSGNSIPDYIPFENFMAMTQVAIERS